jgi:hypothetical protein
MASMTPDTTFFADLTLSIEYRCLVSLTWLIAFEKEEFLFLMRDGLKRTIRSHAMCEQNGRS